VQLNEQLSNSKFLTGDSMTLADITIFCGLALAMTTSLPQGYRKNAISKLNEWFERMSALD